MITANNYTKLRRNATLTIRLTTEEKDKILQLSSGYPSDFIRRLIRCL